MHYTMGGVRTDHTGESPTLKGLFAAGEAACWDMHGFNRLGGNSVAETVVAGMIVGEFIADFCDRAGNDINIPTGLVHELLRREQAKLDALVDGGGTEDASALRVAMQEIMTANVGIFRRGEDLQTAVDELQQLLVRSRNIGVRYKARGANPELVTAYRVQKMLKVALCVAYGALTRTESRGAHYRQDFPRRNDAEWLKRTLATWKGETDTLPSLAYEGARRRPDGAAARLARLRRQGLRRSSGHAEARRRGRGAEAEDGRRAALRPPGSADALQRRCCPSRLRGRNERIDEPLDEPALVESGK